MSPFEAYIMLIGGTAIFVVGVIVAMRIRSFLRNEEWAEKEWAGAGYAVVVTVAGTAVLFGISMLLR